MLTSVRKFLHNIKRRAHVKKVNAPMHRLRTMDSHRDRAFINHVIKVEEDQARGLESRKVRKDLFRAEALYPTQKNYQADGGPDADAATV